MKIFLAGTSAFREIVEPRDISYLLESFYYFDDWQLNYIKTKTKDFLLDSGAYTFMQNSKSHIDWESYIERYASFIVQNNIDHFFELDIDSVVGYEQVKRFRYKLEALTNKQSIPVWHHNRGKDEFIRMCQEYRYVAIGGLVGGNSEYSQKYWRFFPWFIDTAHKNGAKIHALGFTSLKGLEMYHFDSVDSTSWTAGRRYGALFCFNDNRMTTAQKKAGKRTVKRINEYNLEQWIKFQKYAETHL